MSSIAKIFCVTKDETDLIENWIVYHGCLVGFGNLIIIDNESTCSVVLKVYEKYRERGVTFEKCRSYAGTSQGEAFTKSFHKHKCLCRFLIGLDSDNFIQFNDFLDSPGSDISQRQRFHSHLTNLPAGTAKFQIQTYFESVPDPKSPFYVDQKVTDPVRNIRTFIRTPARPSKCFFRSEGFISTVNGCHDGRMKRGKTGNSDLCIVHFNNTGARRATERARSIVSGYGYTDVDAPLRTQLNQLMHVTSPYGSHRVREYGVFLSKAITLLHISGSGRWPRSPAHLQHLALGFPSLNGFRLDMTNYPSLPTDWSSRFDAMVFADPGVPRTCGHSAVVHSIISGASAQPRVALMLSGHFRNFSKRKQFWHGFVKQHRGVDIYIHTWAESGERSPSSWINMGKNCPDFGEVKRTLKPVSMIVEDHREKAPGFSWQQDGLDLFYTQFPGLAMSDDFTKSVASQLYSISRAFDLAESSGNEYDVYVRLRADAVVDNFSELLTRKLHFVRDDVLVVNGSNNHVHPAGGRGCSRCDTEFKSGARRHADHSNDVCDIFYYANLRVMKKVAGMFHHARDLVKSFKFHNARAIANQAVKPCLVRHGNVIGVKNPKVFEHQIKCFYPERLIREYMKDFWLLSDPLGMTPRVVY